VNLITISEGTVYPNSVVTQAGATYFLARLGQNGERRLGVKGEDTGFVGTAVSPDNLRLCPLIPENARQLRSRLAWLKPVPLGQQTSFGFGDRLGSATGGHIRALQTADPQHTVAPIFAQQSVRENSRIGRTSQQVLDDAMWGVFQQGWHLAWGADADHIKEKAQLNPFVAAGYTFYTIDPSDHVDNEAQTDSLERLRAKAAVLSWQLLQTNYADTRRRYCSNPFVLQGLRLAFDEEILLRALVKYGQAISHMLIMTQELAAQMRAHPFELEMSVDETDTPTSVYEHFYIVCELQRLGVSITSLAPRFVGKFQKGVDDMGDLAEFERELVKHSAIMQHFANYKLSIHTGSDKFAIYPMIARLTQGRVHVKTAGTSYLEALRVIAAEEPALFRRILELSRARFERDRKTYFLDGRLNEVPRNEQLTDRDLPDLLEHFDSRQLLHVTFGSVPDEFRAEFHEFMNRHEIPYTRALTKHFVRHLLPFVM
jgi:hypothetical protein